MDSLVAVETTRGQFWGFPLLLGVTSPPASTFLKAVANQHGAMPYVLKTLSCTRFVPFPRIRSVLTNVFFSLPGKAVHWTGGRSLTRRESKSHWLHFTPSPPNVKKLHFAHFFSDFLAIVALLAGDLTSWSHCSCLFPISPY